MKRLRLGLSDDKQHLVIRSAAGREEVSEYSFGIEEEYFLADKRTLDVAVETPNELFEAANWSTGGQAMREMLQSQLEVVSNVHVDVGDAREELYFLRREVASVADQYGFAIMACGTHPTAAWRMSQPSPKPRYEEMIEDLRSIGHRNMMCGMHVHVQLPDPEKRFAVMRAMIPYLPLFIALSTSSPFWNSHKTGLKGYRLAAYSELPRTGLPELFETKHQYEDYVEALKKSGVIPNESYIWWAMRPSMRHPTLELRAPDTCTFVDDAVAIASLYRALARHLYLRSRTLAAGHAASIAPSRSRTNGERSATAPIASLLPGRPGDRTGDAEPDDYRGCSACGGAGMCSPKSSAAAPSCTSAARRTTSFRPIVKSGGQLSAVTHWIEAATVSRAEPSRSQAPVEPAE